MQIELWWIGKTSDKYLSEGILDYQKRIRRFITFEIVEIKASNSKRTSEQVLHDEHRILDRLDSRDILVLLDEKGKQFNSPEFAAFIESALQWVGRKIIFVIGSAYGFSPGIRKRAQHQVSLSSMTFTHDMVRLIFLEQLYRAFTIRANLPYHH